MRVHSVLKKNAQVNALDPRLSGSRSEMRKLAVLFMSIGGLGLPETRSSSKLHHVNEVYAMRHADLSFLRAVQRALLAIQEGCSRQQAPRLFIQYID